MRRTGLDEFKNFVKGFRSVSAYASVSAGAGTVAVPLAAIIAKLSPPWPPGSGVIVITLVAELLVLIWIFQTSLKIKQTQLKRRMKSALIILCLGFLAYDFLYASFTGSLPKGKGRYVKGFVLQPITKQLIAEDPTYSADEALKGAEYDTEKIWVGWSINTMSIVLLVLWIVSFAELAIFVGSFTLFQQRQPMRKPIKS